MKRIVPLLLLLLASLSFLEGTRAQTTPDPGVAGPYTVTKDSYNLGDLAYKPPSFPNNVEVRGSVHYPTGLSAGPYPVIVLLHGRHTTCYRTTPPYNTTLTWPCNTATHLPITSFEGYDYLARFMASHGYIVISISCNAINAADASLTDRGMAARAELLQYHLNLWQTFNTTGGTPFGTTFVGKLDLGNIGTLGHSRGGEGVIYHALYNKTLGSPFGIKAVLTLAPTNFYRRVVNDIPIMNVAPYCDGDVSGIGGVHYFDDARYPDVADESSKYSVLMMGANHNFFNTVWTPGSYIAGTSDDWNSVYGSTAIFCGSAAASSRRFDTTKQKAALLTYASAFFRKYLGNEPDFDPILETADIKPPASSLADSADIYVSFHPGSSRRLDINRMDTTTLSAINNLSGTVSSGGLVLFDICNGGYTMPSCNVSTVASKEPHKRSATTAGLGQLNIKWNNDTDWYDNAIPDAHKNFTRYKHLLFRAAVNFTESAPGQNMDFSVVLTDSLGQSDSVAVSQLSNVLFYQPGNNMVLPKVMFNTVKMPLDSFHEIDQTKISNVRLLFNRFGSGAVLVSDIALADTTNPCAGFTAALNDTVKGLQVFLYDSTKRSMNDSLAWFWSFGDPASGTADTSTMQHPVHIYSGPGTFNACLRATLYRSNGAICTDTACVKVMIVVTGTADQTTRKVQISPNPASGYLYLSGTMPGDRLRLVNMYGQSVLAVPITDPVVALPAYLPNGVYHAVIETGGPAVYYKLVIAR